jgi:TRAP-type mannitol/chloroaromatic compound transport system substrate-binding protein
MERRQFLRGAATGAAAFGLVACTGSAVTGDGGSADEEGNGEEGGEQVALDDSLPEIDVEMATSWPLGLDTIFGGAQVFAERVGAMTGGRFTITPRAGNELVPALEVLDAVESGGVPMGHTASYY